ncbi:MAG: phosphoribosylformylglycinamidine cyclo-ligase [Acidimicrobiales bacterium]
MGETYESAGVSLADGERAVARVTEMARATFRPEVIGGLGGFGGLFALDRDRYAEPVLVASTDGVGTKAVIAQVTGRFDTIGLDLVAMCVDDVVCHGAEPLFLLDHIAVERLDPDHVAAVVAGVAEGCRQAGCALIGGETAEHPGAMAPATLELSGCAVGVVDRDRLVTGARVAPGDVLIGLPSTGLRANGYSLARRVLVDRPGADLAGPAYLGARHSLADELLRPSVLYAPAVLELLGAVDVRAVAHITGGGIVGNLPRALSSSVDAVVELGSWEVPPIFEEIRRRGPVDDEEMARVFNLGLGMVVVVPATQCATAIDVARSAGHRAVVVGEVVPGDGGVKLVPGPTTTP